MIDGSKLKSGDRVTQSFGTVRGRGVVDTVTEEGNYVRISWRHAKRPDVLSRQSPLWRLMELET